MKPGRDMDALVAEKVMWWKDCLFPDGAAVDGWGMPPSKTQAAKIPSYSEDIAAAWEVVHRLTNEGWIVTLIASEFGGTDCILECAAGARGRHSSDNLEGLMITTAPHAICLAALRAVGVAV